MDLFYATSVSVSENRARCSALQPQAMLKTD